jgi:epoxyqueuosine reductase
LRQATALNQNDFLKLKKDIRRWALDLGFQDLGVTDLDLTGYAPHVRRWLEKGFQGEMGYLTRNLEKRLTPSLLHPGTIRIISARMDYLKSDTQPLEVLKSPDLGYISRYALGRDYHKTLRQRLARLGRLVSEAAADLDHNFRAFTDSAPVLEKALAEKSGLGWIGKHTLVLNRQAGSWFFLGEIFTNLPLPVDEPTRDEHCGNCRACITVCPTDAIIGPRQLDARRCISYLTIEHKGPIPEELRDAMGNRIYGCDDCQLYCPWNRYASNSVEPDFEPRGRLAGASLLELFAWSEDEFLRATEGSAIRRISYDQWQRNLAVAIGNGPASEGAISALESRRAESTALVAEHIDWAVLKLNRQAATVTSTSLIARTDPDTA